MLINSEKKFVALVEALRLVATKPGSALSESDRATLTSLIARGWSAADAVAFLTQAGASLH